MHEDVSAEAAANLASWGCANDAPWWAQRLAFPFLSEDEHRQIRSKKAADELDRLAVYLIHGRAGGILGAGTIAKYAFGSMLYEGYRLDWDKGNPFLE